jgi:hypothetical protein
MQTGRLTRTAATWGAAVLGLGAATYAGYVGVTWLRYGHAAPPRGRQADPLLDRFIPVHDVVERHRIYVAAPAAVTLQSAAELDLQRSVLVRAIFKGRELLLGSTTDEAHRPTGLLALTRSLGWGVLAETPDREIVMGAATQPWEANVVFRALPPDEFGAFAEPGFVKIAWTLRADPLNDRESIFRTETRVLATDATARVRFRRYWSCLSPGIILIRRAMLGPLRADAERRARQLAAATGGAVREANAP